MSNIDLSAGTLEEQLKEGFLDGLSFAADTQDRVRIYTQKEEHHDWEQFGGHDFIPQAALSILVNLWNKGYGLRVEVTQHLTGDWDQE